MGPSLFRKPWFILLSSRCLFLLLSAMKLMSLVNHFKPLKPSAQLGVHIPHSRMDIALQKEVFYAKVMGVYSM